MRGYIDDHLTKETTGNTIKNNQNDGSRIRYIACAILQYKL